MRNIRKRSRRNRGEQGFALLLAVFLTTLLLVAAIVAAPSVRTERQREKEQEMIWRGKQYVRAVKLYYRKNGRFPTTLDDLTKPKLGGLRFLRQAYKDPMNKEDGAWRLIYVGPAGQLIGSTKPPQPMQLQGGQGGTAPGTTGSAFGSGFGSAQAGSTNSQQGTIGGAAVGAPGSAQTGTGTSDSGFGQNAGSPRPVDTSSFVGGNIIGVGSKADKASIIVYEKATNYHQFEFIWDPSKDAMVIGGAGAQTGTPGQPVQNPGQAPGAFGSQPGQPSQQPGSPAPTQPDVPLSNNPQ